MKLLFFFGDSITLGVGDQHYSGWPARLAQQLAEQDLLTQTDTIYNLGARKNTSKDIAFRWRSEFLSRSLAECSCYMFFCFGTVDMASPKGTINVPIDESIAHTESILHESQKLGQVFLISPLPVYDAGHSLRIERLIGAYARICERMSIPFLDVYHAIDIPAYINDLADGLHPGAKGNELIADVLSHFDILRLSLAADK